MAAPHFGTDHFSEEEQAAVQRALQRRLGPNFVSMKPQGGGKYVPYLETGKAVSMANEVFGYNGWSHSVTSQSIDFIDHTRGRYWVGVSATVKVTLKDGSYHEDVGYGQAQNIPCKGLALAQARKGAVSDGLKRSMKSFGNILGNCLQDKEYLKMLGGLNKVPVNFSLSEVVNSQEELGLAEVRSRAGRRREAARKQEVLAGRLAGEHSKSAPPNQAAPAATAAASIPLPTSTPTSTLEKRRVYSLNLEKEEAVAGTPEEVRQADEVAAREAKEAAAVEEMVVKEAKEMDPVKAERLRKAELRKAEFERQRRKMEEPKQGEGVELLVEDGEEMWEVMSQMPTGERLGQGSPSPKRRKTLPGAGGRSSPRVGGPRK